MFKSVIYIGLKTISHGINMLLKSWKILKTFNLGYNHYRITLNSFTKILDRIEV